MLNPVAKAAEAGFELPEDGWVQIAPAGRFPVTAQTADGGVAHLVQVLDEAAFEAIVADFANRVGETITKGQVFFRLDREEAERLGLLPKGAKVEPVEKEFNDDLEASVKSLPRQQIDWLKKAFGDQVQELGWELKWQGTVVGDFYRDVIAGRRKKGHVKLGIATAKAIAEAAKHGIDLRGKELRLDAAHARHIHDRHGPGNETDPTQRPVTPLDVELFPQVWRDPDRSEKGHGGNSVIFWKHLLGEMRMVAVEDRRNPEEVVQVTSALVKTSRKKSPARNPMSIMDLG